MGFSGNTLVFVLYIRVGRVGMISRVLIVNFPPDGVNLHALLLTALNLGYLCLELQKKAHLARFVIIWRKRVSSPVTTPSTSGCSSICFSIDSMLSPIASYAACRAVCFKECIVMISHGQKGANTLYRCWDLDLFPAAGPEHR